MHVYTMDGGGEMVLILKLSFFVPIMLPFE